MLVLQPSFCDEHLEKQVFFNLQQLTFMLIFYIAWP